MNSTSMAKLALHVHIELLELPGPATFSKVKRRLVTFCNSKSWTRQAAARGAGNRYFVPLKTPRTYKTAVQNRFAMENAKER